MELISLKNVPKAVQIKILQKLEHDVEGEYVVDKNKKRVKDRYTDEEVKFSNMLIFPGSTIILDDNSLSIASYMEEFGVTL